MRYLLCNIRIPTQRKAGSLSLFALLVCLAALCQTTYSQTASPQEKPMKHYALVFHSTRTPTADEQKQRAVEIAAWVEGVTDKGIMLDPRNFGETAANFSAEGSKVVSRDGSSDPTLSTIVFFDSPSRDQAVDIARKHPGLHYGVTVEVREWTSPREIAAKR
jgi:hypothetical protein